ncbi:MAG: DNA repair protein RecO [Thermovirgaceae bacterium]|nr:DNA repair protein RecO [Thermovirgaceae bacterium]
MESRAGQGLLRQRGVVLRRKDSPEGNRSVYVLMENEGPMWLLAPGAARGKVRFGGSTDPLVWGTFHVYRGPNRCYLRDVDVRRDFWSLRASSQKIRQAVKWSVSLVRHTLPGHACDDLLPVFFWSLSLLEEPGIRDDLSDWRFYWRWLRSWGLAPDLNRCQGCGVSLSEAFFSGESLYCGKCGQRTGAGIRLEARDLCVLTAAAYLSYDDLLKNAGQLMIQPETVRSCTRLLENTLAERA